MPNLSLAYVSVIAASCISTAAYAGDLRVPSQYRTPQAAVNAATTGDVVLLAPGVHAGPVDCLGKAITLRGEGASGTTILSGGASVLRFTTNETSSTIVENLTISSGTGNEGAGVRIINAAPLLRNCRIISNVAAGAITCRGGGVFVSGGSPRFEACLIGGNTVQSSGGPAHGGCNSGDQATSNGYGAGMYIENAAVTIIGTTISGNLLHGSASGCNAGVMAMGGGVYKVGNGPLLLENCIITSNVVEAFASAGCNAPCCSATGGGLFLTAPATIRGCRISGNSQTGCGTLVGGIRFESAGIVVDSTRICGNTPSNLTGAFIDAGGNLVAIECPANCAADVNQDGKVDGVDLAAVLTSWGACAP